MAVNFKPLEKIILTRDQVRSCDAVAIQQYAIDGRVLMENAGRSAAQVVLDHLKESNSNSVCILAGPGNNGGDGYVVARHLANHNIPVATLICCDRNKIKGDAQTNLEIIEKMNLTVIQTDPETIIDTVRRHAASADFIVDALLGTGTAGPPRDPIRSIIKTINDLNKTTIALDIPSGLDCDTGRPLEIAVRANHTVTFAAMKKGFQNPDAKQYTGLISVASIGIHTSWLIDNEIQ